MAKKRIKHLVINLPKETKDLYAENYKTPMKEIKGQNIYIYMKGYTMFLDWENQYWENDYCTQSKL